LSTTDTSARAAGPRGSALRRIGAQPIGAGWWMAAAFVVSLGLAIAVLLHSGAGEDGTALALRVTARWCFLLFWPAYAAGAAAKLFGPRGFGVFPALARRGREFGLAFAAALLVHIGLVLWIISIAADQRSPMLIFWAGVACTVALALFSLPRFRQMLGPQLWKMFCAAALEYIAFTFAVDFIVEPLRASGGHVYPVTYLPFTVALLGGTALRLFAYARERRRRSAPAAAIRP
jgi:hypothetical protein